MNSSYATPERVLHPSPIPIYNFPAMTKRSRAFHPVFQPSVSNSILCNLLFVACLIVMLASTTARAQEMETANGASATPGLYNPVADPKAVVTHGNARFTVLTPQLIRMEWAADGKFEDHASLVFLNRRLPVPNFTVRAAVPTAGNQDQRPGSSL